MIWNDEHLEISPNRMKTGCFYSIFTNYPHLKVFKWKPVSKPDLNRLFIGCFEKNRLSYGKKYTSKEKKSTKFIFKQILNTVCGVFLEMYTRSHGLDMQIQSAKRNKNTSSRHSPFYKGTILIDKPSRQKCFVVNPKENWREFSVLDTSDF